MGTDTPNERTLAIAEHVLVNTVNQDLVDRINGRGAAAMGLHSLSSCVIFARRLFLYRAARWRYVVPSRPAEDRHRFGWPGRARQYRPVGGVG